MSHGPARGAGGNSLVDEEGDHTEEKGEQRLGEARRSWVFAGLLELAGPSKPQHHGWPHRPHSQGEAVL